SRGRRPDAAAGSVTRRSPQRRLGAHQEADRADEAGHEIREVTLAARAGHQGPIVGLAPDLRQAPEARPLDEEREAKVKRVDREGDEEPGLRQERDTEYADERGAGQGEPETERHGAT